MTAITQPTGLRPDQESFEAQTTGWDAATTRRVSDAARSMIAIDRLPQGSQERRDALRHHGVAFSQPMACRVR